MRFERLVAFLLVVACGAAAMGAWRLRGESSPSTTPVARAKSPLARALAADAPEMVVLSVDGMILEAEPGGFGASGAGGRFLVEAVRKLREAPPKVLLLRINSPGGTAAASQAVYDEILRLKKDKGVKVVASMGDVCASGGYLIASAADRIVANPATMTGSIGVIMQLMNYEGLFGKIGVKGLTIKAGKFKDMGSAERAITREERQIFQAMVDDIYDLFLNSVALGRKWDVAKLRPLAEGRIYTGRQALKVGLVDALGNFEVAKSEARRLGGIASDVEPEEAAEDEWQKFFKMISAGSDPVTALAGRRQALMSAAYDRVPLMVMD
ncbi:MAG: signal peptide peptidase SppA [Candidatus Sericytochromatia bacterium]|nr:signal peptide peptidase SppA [Candidatus Sericytochromatia bacterium]